MPTHTTMGKTFRAYGAAPDAPPAPAQPETEPSPAQPQRRTAPPVHVPAPQPLTPARPEADPAPHPIRPLRPICGIDLSRESF